jgi:hypothetical protein
MAVRVCFSILVLRYDGTKKLNVEEMCLKKGMQGE